MIAFNELKFFSTLSSCNLPNFFSFFLFNFDIYKKYLCNVDPFSDDFGAVLSCPVVVLFSLRAVAGRHQDGGNDPERDGVELVDGGDHGGRVSVPGRLVSSGPHGTQTLVRNQALEQLTIHTSQLLSEHLVRNVQNVAVGGDNDVAVGFVLNGFGWKRGRSTGVVGDDAPRDDAGR